MQCYWSLLCTQPGTFWGAFLSQLRLGIVEEKAGRVDIGEEHFAYAFLAARGRRKTMEDFAEVKCLPSAEGEATSLVWLAVYDGHGGDQVAKFCQENLFDMFVDALEDKSQPTVEDILAALRKAYRTMDMTLSGYSTEAKYGAFARPLRMGSTGTTAIVTGAHTIIAHIGDSQAMLVHGSTIQYFTRAHTAHQEDEKERIEGTSAVITTIGRELRVYDPRIKRSLNLTRAFGNFHLKDDKKLAEEAQAIICVPEIKVIERTTEGRSLFIASDGLWDVTDPDGLNKSAMTVPDEYEYADLRTRRSVHAIGVRAHMSGSADNITVLWLRSCQPQTGTSSSSHV